MASPCYSINTNLGTAVKGLCRGYLGWGGRKAGPIRGALSRDVSLGVQGGFHASLLLGDEKGVCQGIWWPLEAERGSRLTACKEKGPLVLRLQGTWFSRQRERVCKQILKFFPRTSSQEPSLTPTPQSQSYENRGGEPAGTPGLLTYRTSRSQTGFALVATFGVISFSARYR